MKILFLAKDYPPASWHGVSVYVRNTSHALAKRGHEVHVLDCSSWHRPHDELDGEVVVHYRRTMRLRGIRRLRKLVPVRISRYFDKRALTFRRDRVLQRLNWAFTYYREYRRLQTDFDVVEAYDVFLLGLLFSLLHPRPFVVSIHSPPKFFLDPKNTEAGERTWRFRILDLGDRLNIRGADLITSPSRLAARHRGLVDAQRARIIPYMVEPTAWESVPPVELTAPVVLAYGLESIKAPEVLVDAAARLRSQVEGLDVMIVGRSVGTRSGREYGDWLTARIRELDAPVRLVDQVPHSRMTELFAAARVVAIPSWFETFGQIGAEAMAAGRPVVCTSEAGLADMAARSGAITVVPPGDPSSLAEALRPFLESAEKAAEAGARGRRFVRKHLASDRIGGEREAAYEEAVRRWKGRRPRSSRLDEPAVPSSAEVA